MYSKKKNARIAGLLYLLIAISGGFSIGYLPTIILASGDASTTAQNIINNQGLFQLGFVADIIVFLLEIVLTVMLYRLFKPINQFLSMIAAYSRLAMSVVMGLNLLNYIIPMLLLSGSDYLNVFETNQLQSLALLFLNVHQYVVYIWGLFFAVHLLFLGYLLFKSNFFPKIIGILMMLGSLGYFGESLKELTFSDNEIISLLITLFLIISVVGELSFTFWLLIKGLNVEEWSKKMVI